MTTGIVDQTAERTIDVKGLTFGYTETPVLRDISLHVDEGECVCLTGSNGCGKSTLVKLLIGELRFNTGTIEVLGKPVSSAQQLTEVGYLPQNASFSKIAFPITAMELAVQGLLRDFGWPRIPRARHKKKVAEVFESLGLTPQLNVPFNELSGGLQQRVLIARALLAEPKLLILDEPTTGVDKESRVQFLHLLEELRTQKNLGMLIVTHDVRLIQQYMEVTRVCSIEEGRLVNA